MNAGKNLKSGSLNVTLGFGAGGNLDADLSENGKVQTEPALAGTYSQTGTTITVTATASGVVAGNKVGIRFTSGDLSATGDMQWMNVAKIGRASCRERVCQYVKISVVAVSLKKKTTK